MERGLAIFFIIFFLWEKGFLHIVTFLTKSGGSSLHMRPFCVVDDNHSFSLTHIFCVPAPEQVGIKAVLINVSAL